MSSTHAPWHAHIYYDGTTRALADGLRATLQTCDHILFVGALTDRPAGPHPIPQFEVHFTRPSLDWVVETLSASGLRALVHPLTDDDLADHTTLARWIGEPVVLDTTVLDPPGINQGMDRFGKSDF